MMINLSCENITNVDKILINGTIYTLNADFDINDCLVINADTIVDSGSEKEILEKYSADTIIDLKGKSVYPGFNDAHCHLRTYAILNNLWVNLKKTKSYEEVIERIVEYDERNDYKCITGRGWDQNLWKMKEMPDNKLLNKKFPEKPVILVRVDGHAVLANDAALKMAGLDMNSSIEGGKIFKNKAVLTGLLLDKAADYMKGKIPEPSAKALKNALINAQQDCLEKGLTSITDAGLSKEILLLYDSLQKESLFKIRINAMIIPERKEMDYFTKNIYDTDMFRVRSVKLYMDGALGSRGALLLKPYADDSSNKGILVETFDKYNKICGFAKKNDFQVCTHAIGDSANRLILNIYKNFLERHNDKRWRVEHAQVVNPDDIDMFGRYNIIPSVQATHATSDMYWAKERLGKKRIKHAYAYKDLLKQNLWLPNGTDFPIENINPLYTYYAAVSRKDLNSYPENGFNADQALNRKEALYSICLWPAKAAFMEQYTGSLEKGKKADLVVLSKDIYKIPENEIPYTKVLKTMINGTFVYNATIKKN